jgi:hypothetical protein
MPKKGWLDFFKIEFNPLFNSFFWYATDYTGLILSIILSSYFLMIFFLFKWSKVVLSDSHQRD